MEHNNLKLQVGVKALIFNKNKDILLLKRIPERKGEDSCWDIPGGRINNNRSLLSNLLREIKEETSLNSISNPVILSAQDVFFRGSRIVRVTYVARVTSSRVVKLSSEHSEYKWVKFDDLMKIKDLDKHVRIIIKDKDKVSLIKSFINKV